MQSKLRVARIGTIRVYCHALGARGTGVVTALCYKPEGRGFDIREGDFLKFT
jgi:hypothetical protein